MVQKYKPFLFVRKQQEAYNKIWDTIMERIQFMDDSGTKRIFVEGYPPVTMRHMANDLNRSGYAVEVEVGEYSGKISLAIAWD